MSNLSDDWFAPPSGSTPPPAQQPPVQQPPVQHQPVPAGPPAGPPPPPQAMPSAVPGGQAGSGGWYPQQAYYAPGWSAPVAPAPRVRRRLGRRFWLPVAGVATAGLLVVGVLGVRFWFDSRPLGQVDAETTVASSRVGVGHCLKELPADGEVGRVTLVPCSEPHVAEVIAALQVPVATWPGQQGVNEAVARWCEMDTTEKAAGFHAVVWSPSARGWRQGDHLGLCLAALSSGTATGSFSEGEAVTTG